MEGCRNQKEASHLQSIGSTVQTTALKIT